MFKNTKKGFTILELLATIIILAVIFLIAMSIIPNIMGAVYKRVCTINEGMMQKAAFNFYSLGKDDLPSKEGETKEVSLDKLITSKSIKAVVDPKTKQVCDRENSKVMIKMINGDYQISSVLKCQTCIDGKQDNGGYEEEMWDGWITLVLYYPESSTERKWRLSEEGEVRFDPMLHWQDYTGPITIPLNRVEDVWISYEIDGVEFVIPPAGRLLVDIRPDYKGRELVDKINVSIKYDDEAELKEYRVGGSGWMDYTGPFVVTENIIIEARAKKQEKVYDQEGNLLMTRNVAGRDIVYIGNIGIQEDVLEAPTLTRLPAQNENEVARVRITYPDGADKKIFKLNYGLEETYTNEISIKNYGTRVIGYYYNNENKRSKARSILINDTTMELESPQEDYNPNKPGDRVPTPEDKVGTESIVTIDYTDSVTKQYKVGTTNPTWITYTGSFSIDSYNILSKGWQNEDNTVTIYAKGKDVAGNEATVHKKIYNLDLDMPKAPIVKSNYGYPILASYGVVFDGSTTIEFDSRTDVEHSYSTDNGVTWKTYAGEFQSLEGTIIARSVKRDTGLTTEITHQINMPADALKYPVYDGDESTFTTDVVNKYMKIDKSLINKSISLTWYRSSSAQLSIRFLDNDLNLIKDYQLNNYGQFTETYEVPLDSYWITFNKGTGGTIRVHEITTANEPTFTATDEYMLIHADFDKIIQTPYQMVNIEFFPTSVERLYKIDDTNTWKSYQDKPIMLEQGKTIYAKGIDKDGNETNKISSLTANVANSISTLMFDNDESTFTTDVINKYMKIDKSLMNKNISLTWYRSSSAQLSIQFLDNDLNLIKDYQLNNYGQFTETYEVPLDSYWITFNKGGSGTIRVHELKVEN